VNLINNTKVFYPNSEVNLRIYKEDTKLILVFLITVLDLTIIKQELFKKFTKMSKLGTSNEGSTGIGLYLCRNIIKKPRTTYRSK
jgi:K+-sensing histidine kinase KdpD